MTSSPARRLVSLTVELRNYSPTTAEADWPLMLSHAKALDAAGVDRVVVSDHVAFGERLDAYGDPQSGGRIGGVQPTGPDGEWLEPLTTLAVIAGQTDQIRLGTNILLAALRRPAVLAKIAATLDVLSSGRLELGVGIGWQREEYEVAGLDYSRRGELLDHTLAVCRALWTQTSATYASPDLQFEAIHAMPKPTQSGGIPVWVAGTVNNRVARRIAANGGRWVPWGADADDLRTGIHTMRTLLKQLPEAPELVAVSGPLRLHRDLDGRVDVEASMAAVPALVETGVTDLRIHPRLPADPVAAQQLMKDLVNGFRRATDGFSPGRPGGPAAAR